jgi:hypothetical protein
LMAPVRVKTLSDRAALKRCKNGKATTRIDEKSTARQNCGREEKVAQAG